MKHYAVLAVASLSFNLCGSEQIQTASITHAGRSYTVAQTSQPSATASLSSSSNPSSRLLSLKALCMAPFKGFSKIPPLHPCAADLPHPSRLNLVAENSRLKAELDRFQRLYESQMAEAAHLQRLYESQRHNMCLLEEKCTEQQQTVRNLKKENKKQTRQLFALNALLFKEKCGCDLPAPLLPPSLIVSRYVALPAATRRARSLPCDTIKVMAKRTTPLPSKE